jgi:hypothetical protein
MAVLNLFRRLGVSGINANQGYSSGYRSTDRRFSFATEDANDIYALEVNRP